MSKNKITLTVGNQSISFAADDVNHITAVLNEATSRPTGSSKYHGRDGIIQARFSSGSSAGEQLVNVSATKMVDSKRAVDSFNANGIEYELTDC